MKPEKNPGRSLSGKRKDIDGDSRRFDLPGLPGCRPLDNVEMIGNLEVQRAEYYMPKVLQCPSCRHKKLKVTVPDKLLWDAPSGGLYPRLVQLFYKVIECKKCGEEIMPPVSELIYPNHEMTCGLVKYILHRMTSLDTFERIGIDTRQDAETIRNIFMEECAQWEEKRGKDLPLRLGIDEIKIGKVWLIVFVDLDKGGAGIVDVLLAVRKQSQVLIQTRLLAAGNRDEIEIVTLDFSSPYRDAIRLSLKNAKLVGDFFHLVKILQSCFDKVRLDVQNSFEEAKSQENLRMLFEAFPLGVEKDLENIARARAKRKVNAKVRTFKKHDRRILKKKGTNVQGVERLLVEALLGDKPLLKEAYELKVAFEDIFAKQRTLEKTSELLIAWKNSIKNYMMPYFQRMTDLIDDWHQEICRYAETGATNAMTECKNGLLRLYSLIGRGYDYQTLRARAVWADAHRRTRIEVVGIEGMSARAIMTHLGQKKHIENILDEELNARRETLTPAEG